MENKKVLSLDHKVMRESESVLRVKSWFRKQKHVVTTNGERA